MRHPSALWVVVLAICLCLWPDTCQADSVMKAVKKHTQKMFSRPKDTSGNGVPTDDFSYMAAAKPPGTPPPSGGPLVPRVNMPAVYATLADAVSCPPTSKGTSSSKRKGAPSTVSGGREMPVASGKKAAASDGKLGHGSQPQHQLPEPPTPPPGSPGVGKQRKQRQTKAKYNDSRPKKKTKRPKDRMSQQHDPDRSDVELQEPSEPLYARPVKSRKRRPPSSTDDDYGSDTMRNMPARQRPASSDYGSDDQYRPKPPSRNHLNHRGDRSGQGSLRPSHPQFQDHANGNPPGPRSGSSWPGRGQPQEPIYYSIDPPRVGSPLLGRGQFQEPT